MFFKAFFFTLVLCLFVFLRFPWRGGFFVCFLSFFSFFLFFFFFCFFLYLQTTFNIFSEILVRNSILSFRFCPCGELQPTSYIYIYIYIYCLLSFFLSFFFSFFSESMKRYLEILKPSQILAKSRRKMNSDSLINVSRGVGGMFGFLLVLF